MSGCAATWERCSCRRSTWRWEAGLGSTTCASSRLPAAAPLHWNTTATFIPAITTSSLTICSGTSWQTPMAELVASEKQRAFGQDKLNSLPKYCRECEVRFACHGECPRNRFINDPGWRARAQLPLRRLQAILQPYRPRDEDDGRPASPGPICRRDHGVVPAQSSMNDRGNEQHRSPRSKFARGWKSHTPPQRGKIDHVPYTGDTVWPCGVEEIEFRTARGLVRQECPMMSVRLPLVRSRSMARSNRRTPRPSASIMRPAGVVVSTTSVRLRKPAPASPSRSITLAAR